MHSSSPTGAVKLQQVIQPSTGRHWDPPKKKDTPHPRTKEKLQRNGRKDTIMIKPNPIHAR